MTSDLDIYRAAQVLIEQHGLKGASDHAADRIQTLRDLKDEEGAATWGRFRAALLDLSEIKFRGDAVN